MAHNISVIQWVLDTRELWPTTITKTTKDQMLEFKVVAAGTLQVIQQDERERALRFLFAKDARMSLASALLKHAVISYLAGVTWPATVVTKDHHHKPCYLSPSSGHKLFDFNVSHQAGLVSLIASSPASPAIDVGTDVVCCNERLDHTYSMIDRDGFFAWIDMHADVFHPSEVLSMKVDALHLNLDVHALSSAARTAQISSCQYRGGSTLSAFNKVESGSPSETRILPHDVISQKLRRFYAFWGLREAYVKMTGEALMAEWLTRLEFRNVRAPEPSSDATEHGLEPGEVAKDIETWFEGRPVPDVVVELRAYGKHYMIASAVKRRVGEEVVFPGYAKLDFEKDIMSAATSFGAL